MNYLDLGYSKTLVRQQKDTGLDKLPLSEMRSFLPSGFIGADFTIKAGQSDYADGTGFFLGKSGDVYKFSIGDSTYYVRWDGSTLSTRGALNADDITAGTLSADRIAAGSITADKMGISTLSAITANMGAITAGTITLPNTGWIKGGQTAYNTGTGFFLGYDTTAYKLSIGDASTNALTWDGSTLTIRGTLNAGDLTVGTLSVNRISDDSLVNAKIEKRARAYKFIVAPSGGDYDNIQDAIDAANSDGGGRIYISAGTYTQTADLTIYDNITLEGDPNGGSTISFGNAAYNIQIVKGSLANADVTLRYLTISGSEDTEFAIKCYLVKNVRIERCIFSGNKTSAGAGGDIYLDNAYNIYIDGNISDDAGTFVYGADATNVYVRDNIITGTRNYSIWGRLSDTLGGFQKSFFVNNRIDDPRDSCVYGEFHRVVFSGCLFLVDSAYPFSNPVVNLKTGANNMGWYGVFSNCDVPSSGDINSGDGVHIDTNYWRVYGNQISAGDESSQKGLYITGDQNIITANRVYGDGKAIHLEVGADNNVVVGNIASSSGIGIDDDGTGNVVANNKTI